MVLIGNRQDKAEQARQALAAEGQVAIIVADLMTEEGMKHVLDTINAEHKDVSLLVNAAGVFFPKPFTEHEASDYDMYMSINRATFFITRDVVRNMVEAGIKGIYRQYWLYVGTASYRRYTVFSLLHGKAGLHALTKNLAIELGSNGIRVNAVSPAVVHTPIYEGFILKTM